MDRLAAEISALSNEKRLWILQWLKDPKTGFDRGEATSRQGICGQSIADRLGVTPATASVHLKILTQAGLIRAVRVGKFTYFERDDAALAALAEKIAQL
ncbi:helix-turn-helix transcriptional regulator [Martelella alba]|uniref:Helix-turn-helix transcriptional regulator n=1 Tax=Martelella alba TaxID=2590451 RepID=A0A506U769_9HYPH|nr:helix-turn-helix domain-containing protein [Martelella alba]TPW29196.1 helix-turn-helix transcriptional regulator [Martelella alba]